MKGRGAKVGLLLGTTVFVLVLGELGLRLVWTPKLLVSSRVSSYSAVSGFAPIPGATGVRDTHEYRHAFRHNQQGFRATQEFTTDLPPGIRARVLFLGDSFTYGLGSPDDETFVERVNQALPDVEVINAGCGGFGTRESLARLDYVGPALSPDVVVLVFFWNDLGDNLKREAPTFGLDARGRVQRLDRPRPDGDPLAPQPYEVPPDRSPWEISYLRELIQEATDPIRYRLLGMSPRFIRDQKMKERAWQLTAKLLDLVARRSEELGADLLIVSLPDHNQVDPDAVIKSIKPLHYEVQDRLREICTDLGIDLLDTLPALQAAWKRAKNPLYYYSDRHLTPEGNRVVADALIPALEPRLSPAVVP